MRFLTDKIMELTFAGIKADLQRLLVPFLKQKSLQDKKTYLCVYIQNYGYYYPLNPRETKRLFSRIGKNALIITKKDQPEIYTLMTQIDDEMQFVYQYITYLSFKCAKTPSKRWLLSIIPKIITDKLVSVGISPKLEPEEYTIASEDQHTFEKFTKILQVNAVKSFILK